MTSFSQDNKLGYRIASSNLATRHPTTNLHDLITTCPSHLYHVAPISHCTCSRPPQRRARACGSLTGRHERPDTPGSPLGPYPRRSGPQTGPINRHAEGRPDFQLQGSTRSGEHGRYVRRTSNDQGSCAAAGTQVGGAKEGSTLHRGLSGTALWDQTSGYRRSECGSHSRLSDDLARGGAWTLTIAHQVACGPIVRSPAHEVFPASHGRDRCVFGACQTRPCGGAR